MLYKVEEFLADYIGMPVKIVANADIVSVCMHGILEKVSTEEHEYRVKTKDICNKVSCVEFTADNSSGIKIIPVVKDSHKLPVIVFAIGE